MGAVLIERSSRPLAAVLAPLLLRQGAAVRREMIVLPEAGGARSGVEGAAPATLRLVFLGESTAAGVGVEDQDRAIGRQTARALHDRTGAAVAWRVVARTGLTAKRALREHVSEAVSEPFDVAVVVLGVNDTLKMRPPAAWAAAMVGIVEALLAAGPDGRVIVSGVPDVGSFPALPQPLRVVMGRQARGLDHRLRRTFRGWARVEIVAAPAFDGGRENLAADGFHPGAAAYAQWAGHLAEHLAGPR